MKHVLMILSLMLTVSAFAQDKTHFKLSAEGESSAFRRGEGKSEFHKYALDSARDEAMEKISQECQYIGQKLSLKTELNIIEENVKEVQDEYESLYRTVVSVTGICSGSRH